MSPRSRTSRTRLATMTGLVASAAVVLSACTGQSAEPAESSTSAAPQPAVSSAAPQAFEAVDCETLGLEPFIAEVADCGYVTVPESRTSGS